MFKSIRDKYHISKGDIFYFSVKAYYPAFDSHSLEFGVFMAKLDYESIELKEGDIVEMDCYLGNVFNLGVIGSLETIRNFINEHNIPLILDWDQTKLLREEFEKLLLNNND